MEQWEHTNHWELYSQAAVVTFSFISAVFSVFAWVERRSWGSSVVRRLEALEASPGAGGAPEDDLAFQTASAMDEIEAGHALRTRTFKKWSDRKFRRGADHPAEIREEPDDPAHPDTSPRLHEELRAAGLLRDEQPPSSRRREEIRRAIEGLKAPSDAEPVLDKAAKVKP